VTKVALDYIRGRQPLVELLTRESQQIVLLTQMNNCPE